MAERAIDPSTSAARWVVADSLTLELHLEASVFITSLRARDLSPNTERAYAGRVALYLSYCSGQRLDWRMPSFLSLSGFQRWLVTEPLPPRGHRARAGRPVVRSQNMANAVMTAVASFLRFCVANGWVQPSVAGLLSQPKYLMQCPSRLRRWEARPVPHHRRRGVPVPGDRAGLPGPGADPDCRDDRPRAAGTGPVPHRAAGLHGPTDRRGPRTARPECGRSFDNAPPSDPGSGRPVVLIRPRVSLALG